jgi:hypothetical protein
MQAVFRLLIWLQTPDHQTRPMYESPTIHSMSLNDSADTAAPRTLSVPAVGRSCTALSAGGSVAGLRNVTKTQERFYESQHTAVSAVIDL